MLCGLLTWGIIRAAQRKVRVSKLSYRIECHDDADIGSCAYAYNLWSLLGKIVAQIAHLAVVGMRTMANDLVKLLINTLFHHHDPLVVGVLGLCNHAAYHCVHLCMYSPHVAFFSSNLGLDIFVPTRHLSQKIQWNPPKTSPKLSGEVAKPWGFPGQPPRPKPRGAAEGEKTGEWCKPWKIVFEVAVFFLVFIKVFKWIGLDC